MSENNLSFIKKHDITALERALKHALKPVEPRSEFINYLKNKLETPDSKLSIYDEIKIRPLLIGGLGIICGLVFLIIGFRLFYVIRNNFLLYRKI